MPRSDVRRLIIECGLLGIHPQKQLNLPMMYFISNTLHGSSNLDQPLTQQFSDREIE